MMRIVTTAKIKLWTVGFGALFPIFPIATQVREDPSLIDAKQHLLRVDPVWQLLEPRMLRFAPLQPAKGSRTGLLHIRIGRRILHTLIKRHGNVRTQVPYSIYSLQLYQFCVIICFIFFSMTSIKSYSIDFLYYFYIYSDFIYWCGIFRQPWLWRVKNIF